MNKRIWTDEDVAYIIKLYTQKGLTCVEIGRVFATKADKISQILKANRIPINNRKINRRMIDSYFSEIDTEAKAYYIGLLLADGSIVLDSDGKRQASISLELTESDVDIIQKLKQEINIDSALRYDKRKNRKIGTWTLRFRSNKMADDLARFGIVPNKTKLTTELHLHYIPSTLLRHFLRGFVDGDGSIYMSNGKWHVSFTGHSRELIEAVGILAYRLIDMPKTTNSTYCNGVAKITLNSDNAIKLLDILYTNTNWYIARKHSKAMECLEDKRVEDMV